MITDKEYLNLLDYCYRRSLYFNSVLSIKYYSESGKIKEIFMNTDAVDVLHDLIIKFPDYNFKEIKKKVGCRFLGIYYETKCALDPNFKNEANKRYNERIKTDPKLKEHHRERCANYWRKRVESDPEYRIKCNDRRKKWRQLQRELYGKCPN
jgi:hypothetical protein